MASLIMRRLDELRAADSLAMFAALPQARCHEMSGNRKGQLSLDLKHPYCLLFEPAVDPVPLKPDRGLDWGQVTAVRIVEIKDTHG
jgi:proteic killer suppression protein